jgi:hypothetical protein
MQKQANPILAGLACDASGAIMKMSWVFLKKMCELG